MNFKTENSLGLETFWFLSSFISKSVGELGCTSDSCLVFCLVPPCSVYQSAEYLERELLRILDFSPQKCSLGGDAWRCARSVQLCKSVLGHGEPVVLNGLS